MAITDPSDEIQAYLTDRARQEIAHLFAGFGPTPTGTSFQLLGFSVGRGGYNPADPVHITPIVTSSTALVDQVFPVLPTTYYPFADALTQQNPTNLVIPCRLASAPVPTSMDVGLGELGVWAQIINGTTPGEIFLAAIAHFPIKAKTRKDVILLRVVIQF